MKFEVAKTEEQVYDALKKKEKKYKVKVVRNHQKFEVTLNDEATKNEDRSIPVVLKMTVKEKDGSCQIGGRFYYGFYLYTLMIAALVLIAARFGWSWYKKQVDNMVLCGIVTVLFIIVVIVTQIKSQTAKKIIREFMKEALS